MLNKMRNIHFSLNIQTYILTFKIKINISITTIMDIKYVLFPIINHGLNESQAVKKLSYVNLKAAQAEFI